MQSDSHVRLQALDHTQSFIVQAPAGAGKTELLTQRFLKLLTCVEKPEEIIAVTFTRKAAAQMRQRIVGALQFAAQNPEPELAHEKISWNLATAVLKRDQQFQWQLSQNPNRLRIVTIDALCATIVNSMPLLSQVGGEFEVIDFAQPYYETAVEALLTQTSSQESWGGALQQLLLHLDNRIGKISDLLVHLLGKRDQWLPYLHSISQHKEELEHYLNACLTRIVEDHLSALRSAFPYALKDQLLSMIRYIAQQCQELDPEHPLAGCEALYDLPDARGADLPLWQAVIEFLTTKEDTWRKSFTVKQGLPSPYSGKNKAEKESRKAQKEILLSLMEQLSQDAQLLPLLAKAKILPAECLTSQQSEILKALGLLLPVLVAHLQLAFQAKGKIDFIEVSLRALDALGEELAPSEIALRLDHQYRHILIDEYQDTSVTQFRLFEKLIAGWQPNEGRTLFLVGDPMQSIYRFRGAEVSLFMHTQKYGLGCITLSPLLLKVNFRSDTSIIEWINNCFVTMFPQTEDPTLGGVLYSSAIAHKNNAQAGVKICAVNNVTEQNDQIVKVIEQHLAQTDDHTIAVLVRARKHLAPLIQKLKQNNIAFIAHEAEQLSKRSHVIDLLSLLKALRNDQDTIAWYSVLRAPWLGLDLNDLLALAKHNQTNNLLQTIFDFEQCGSLSEGAVTRLRKFVPLLQYWLANKGRSRLCSWLRSFWLAIGGPNCYEQINFLNDIDNVLKLIDRCEKQEGVDDAALELRLSQLYADIAPLSGATSPRVCLMTIHKAKGLEFDTVILPDLHAGTRGQDQSLLLWLERINGDNRDLILAPYRSHSNEPDRLYSYVSKQMREKDRLEAVRLLYVGATRAKQALYLFGQSESHETGELKTPSRESFWGLLWPHIKNTVEQQIIVTSAQFTEKPLLTRTIQRLPLDWKLPEPLSHSLNVVQQDQPSEPNIPEYEDPCARDAGIVFHRILQSLNSSTLLEAIQPTALIALKRMGYSGSKLQQGLDLVMLGLRNMLHDLRGQWILDPAHTQRHNEWALSVKTSQGVQNIIIDTTFIDNTGTRWIVDYKLAATDESEQYRAQLLKYRFALMALEKRSVRCGLYFPLLKAWSELSLDEEQYVETIS